MLDKAKLRHGLLIFLVSLSIILSALLWTTGGSLGDTVEKDKKMDPNISPVSYKHLLAHETRRHLVCRLLN